MIYEGTNGIQANDLTFRKLIHDQGVAFRAMADEIDAFLKAWPQGIPEGFQCLLDNLTHSFAALMDAAVFLLKNGKTNAALTAASSVPFLKLFGNVLGGYYLVRSALLAQEDLTAKKGDPEFLASKILTARFYATHVLPQCAGLAETVIAGANPTAEASEETFV